jgi:hypothetical protein
VFYRGAIGVFVGCAPLSRCRNSNHRAKPRRAIVEFRPEKRRRAIARHVDSAPMAEPFFRRRPPGCVEIGRAVRRGDFFRLARRENLRLIRRVREEIERLVAGPDM